MSTTWEVRTNGHRFIVCHANSTPSTPGAYSPKYSFATQAEAEAEMVATANSHGHAHTAGREPRLETT